MIDLPHVAARVFGTPLMMARGKLEVILGVLGPRLAGHALAPVQADRESAPPVNIAGGRIAVVSVTGTLVCRSGYLDAASGMLSYADIGSAICEVLDDASVQGVVLDLDTPGGEVGGLFDLIEVIRAAKEASGKPLWSVANEGALSAAYALASVADRIYVTRTGEVGSVGVVAVHIDESAADAQAGPRAQIRRIQKLFFPFGRVGVMMTGPQSHLKPICKLEPLSGTRLNPGALSDLFPLARCADS